MLKKLSEILACAMLAASLAGCGGSTASSTASSGAAAGPASAGSGAETAVSGKITIWVWTDISSEIEAYEASHPGTEIEQVVIESGDYLTKIQTTVASGGTLPDLVWGEISNRGQLFEMDILEDLEAAPYKLDTSLLEASVLPTMKTEDGRVVGLERNVTPAGLAYRRGLAEQYLGTSDPEQVAALIPTWDAFIEQGQKAVEASGGKVNMFTSLGDVYYIVNGQSGAMRISDGTIHKDVVEQLFADICKFRDAGIVGKLDQWSPAWYASFGSADALFSPMPSFGQDNWIAPNEADGEADWALIVPPGGGFSWGGTCWGVTRDSGNKELAWDFATWDVLGEGVDMRYANGETPSMAGYMTEEKLQAESPYFGGQKVAEVYAKNIVPTIHTNVPTAYDFADICTIELVLSSLNTDYSMTAQQAAEAYIAEMQNQAPELTVG